MATKQQQQPNANDSVTHSFQVEMSCSGCSGAVERVLARDKRVQHSKVDLATKRVDVVVDSSIPAADVLALVRQAGKPVTPL